MCIRDRDSEGLLALADKGMLFLDELHSLTQECQEKLFLFMDKGVYHRVGDNQKWLASTVRFVFATTENPDQALWKTLFRRIPIVIQIPALKERQLTEKRELIRYIPVSYTHLDVYKRQVSKQMICFKLRSGTMDCLAMQILDRQLSFRIKRMLRTDHQTQ